MEQGTRRSAERRGIRLVGIPAIVVGGGLLAAACGSTPTGTAAGGSATSTTGAKSQNGPAKPAGVTVKAAKVGGVGTVLVTASGRTLYRFAPDQQKKVTCTSSNGCTGVWPPLLLAPGTTSGKAGTGIQASMLGTIKTPDGKTQVTYNHWPLYIFAEDSGPGQAKGQGVVGFGGEWAALAPSGAAVGAHAGATTTTSSGGVYGGY